MCLAIENCRTILNVLSENVNVFFMYVDTNNNHLSVTDLILNDECLILVTTP